jgi:predicted adenylyl cyclase CyaB
METERRVRLSAEELEPLVAALELRGIFLGASQLQKDVYYKERGFRTRTQGPGAWIVRVRYTESRHWLTMKRLTNEDGVWEETETVIDDGTVVERILTSIGAEHAVTVNKSRRLAKLGDMEVIIDEVSDLGTFLELAIEGSDVVYAAQKIDFLLTDLDIPRGRVELRGYPTILLEREGVVFRAR